MVATTRGLGVGEVSGPGQTKFGCDIGKLNGTLKAEVPTLGDVREELTVELSQMAAQEAITKAAEAADVQIPADLEVDPAILKQITLLD